MLIEHLGELVDIDPNQAAMENAILRCLKRHGATRQSHLFHRARNRLLVRHIKGSERVMRCSRHDRHDEYRERERWEQGKRSHLCPRYFLLVPGSVESIPALPLVSTEFRLFSSQTYSEIVQSR